MPHEDVGVYFEDEEDLMMFLKSLMKMVLMMSPLLS